MPLFDQDTVPPSASEFPASGSLLDLDEKQLLAWRMDQSLRGRNAQLLPFIDASSASQALATQHQQGQQASLRRAPQAGPGVFGSAAMGSLAEFNHILNEGKRVQQEYEEQLVAQARLPGDRSVSISIPSRPRSRLLP